ncbi:MAG: dihydroorotate dehydrogenase, partial [Actinomycetota bacterium]
MSPASLAVDLQGVVFPTPVLGASGCFGTGRELSQLIDVRGLGGIVTKSVTARPVRGLPTPRMVETPSGM